MLSIFVEPDSAYAVRLMAAKPSLQTATQAIPVIQPRPAGERSREGYWTQILFETLDLNANIPVQISTLVSSAVKWGDYGTRSDREERKLELFKLVGHLIKRGRLRRIARNFVLLATDEEMKRHQELLSKSAPPIDLPAPNV